jgi:4-alpha-glucanotransferase
MYVAQYEAKPNREPPLRKVEELEVASVNTHDMPPFASFWNALDVDDRLDLGLLDADEAQAERERRAGLRRSLVKFLQARGVLDEDSQETRDIISALLRWLASGPANVVLVNLEDLWEETVPQNTPGTFRERRNWQKKLRYGFEEFCQLPEVAEALKLVNEQRETRHP